MITEDYVSFEIAKLLKEKGFDERCTHFFKNENYLVDMGYSNYHHVQNHELIDEYSAPTLQMAMKWLREKKKRYINVWADPKDAEHDDFSTIFRTQVYDGTSSYGMYEFPTYEEACEAAIKYCLENLI